MADIIKKIKTTSGDLQIEPVQATTTQLGGVKVDGSTITIDDGVISIDDSYASGLYAPSANSIDLTIGTSGTNYTAPANGWIYIAAKFSTTGWLQLNNTTASSIRYAGAVYSTSIWAWIIAYVPVAKDDVVRLSYTGTIDTTANNIFKFVYAQGEI